MKPPFFILLSLLLIQNTFSQQPSSCSCLSLKSGDTIIMGRNHDANLGNCLIVYNPKNIYKEGLEFPEENTPQWKSKYVHILKRIDVSELCEITGMRNKRKQTQYHD